jgi:5,5'-dehydrodivanillate O-demethylase
MPQHNSSEPASRWDFLTRTGRGTPMGDLLRRYWWPIAGAREIERPGTIAVRLMGEDLVLYKDLSGKYGLKSRPHPRRELTRRYRRL